MHQTNVPYINNTNILPLLSQLYVELHNKYGDSLFPIKVLVVGGSALALKYAFRSTVDIDADISFSGEITSSINKVAKNNNIPTDWINQDFMKSESYSRRIWDKAIPINMQFPPSNRFGVYVVNDLDQLCMKAITGRKKDRPDIKFLIEKVTQQGFTYRSYLSEFEYLYGDVVRENYNSKSFIRNLFKSYNAL